MVEENKNNRLITDAISHISMGISILFELDHLINPDSDPELIRLATEFQTQLNRRLAQSD